MILTFWVGLKVSGKTFFVQVFVSLTDSIDKRIKFKLLGNTFGEAGLNLRSKVTITLLKIKCIGFRERKISP